MSLALRQEKLFAPQGSTQLASLNALSAAGFHSCIADGKRCTHVVTLQPHRDPAAITVCCKRRERAITAEEAAGCPNHC